MYRNGLEADQVKYKEVEWEVLHTITSCLPARSDLIPGRPIGSPYEFGRPVTPLRRACELPFSSLPMGCIYGRLPPPEPNLEVTRLLLIPPTFSSCRGCEPAHTWLPSFRPPHCSSAA